jgi:hypothetical protein
VSEHLSGKKLVVARAVVLEEEKAKAWRDLVVAALETIAQPEGALND